MAATEQSPTPPAAPAGPTCASCGAPMAADQRYCLNCGARRGDPRVAPPAAPTQVVAEPVAPRPADVSPLAAVIGIALLGGMLLIGVLIGREAGGDETTPAPVVQVGEPGATTPATGGDQAPPAGGAAAVASEWPQGTDGWTIQLNSVPKDGATPQSVQSAKDAAVSQGASDAAVLDSDLYSSLPPGTYVIYSGVYSDRKSAEDALKGLTESFPGATVIEVSSGSAPAPEAGAPEAEATPPAEAEPPPEDPAAPAGGGTAPPRSDARGGE